MKRPTQIAVTTYTGKPMHAGAMQATSGTQLYHCLIEYVSDNTLVMRHEDLRVCQQDDLPQVGSAYR